MNKNKLHPTQRRLVDLLIENSDDPLTIREMQEVLGLSSTSGVVHHLTQLEKNGYLKRNPYNPRDYTILKDGPEKQVAYLNLYGLAACGPSGSILDENPVDRIPVSTRLLSFPAMEGFMVKAKGDSMTPKISDGDLVIAQKSNDADSGCMVICVNDGEGMIKKIQKEKNGYILISLNTTKYPPFLASKDFRIVGKIRNIISSKL